MMKVLRVASGGFNVHGCLRPEERKGVLAGQRGIVFLMKVNENTVYYQFGQKH